MTVTVFGGNLVTGEITVRRIPVVGGSATQDLGAGAVSAQVRLPVTDPMTGAVTDLPSLLVPGRSFLGFDYGGKIIECGPIWADSYDVDSGRFDIKAAGLLSYFDYRYVLPVLAGGQLPRDVMSTWTASLRTMAKRLVQQAQTHTPALPIVFEDDVAGDNVRTYPGSDLMRVGDALSNLTNVIGGPDIALRAEYKDASHVQWRLMTGDPFLKQSGHDHVWNAAVPGSAVKGTRIDRDATVLSSQHFETGSEVDGVELQAKASDSTLTTAGYPLFQSAQNRSSVLLESTLQGYADEAVVAGRAQLETWAFNARRNPTDDRGNKAGPWLGDYSAGDLAQLVLPVNPRTVAGKHEVRIMSVEADLTDWVSLKLAPRRVFS